MAPMHNTFLLSAHEPFDHSHHGSSMTSIAHAILASPEVIQATPPSILPALCEMLSISPETVHAVISCETTESAQVHQAA